MRKVRRLRWSVGRTAGDRWPDLRCASGRRDATHDSWGRADSDTSVCTHSECETAREDRARQRCARAAPAAGDAHDRSPRWHRWTVSASERRGTVSAAPAEWAAQNDDPIAGEPSDRCCDAPEEHSRCRAHDAASSSASTGSSCACACVCACLASRPPAVHLRTVPHPTDRPPGLSSAGSLRRQGRCRDRRQYRIRPRRRPRRPMSPARVRAGPLRELLSQRKPVSPKQRGQW
mmetsp:Transcript_6658/g.20249  ORF Transcript_6658/g.20249 Transcript_6658/m.20249 type:complete len:233 (-) Transcript_6658:1086-1784(-)